MDISYRKDGYYMKKFTLYSFSADDEGGYGVCKSEKFTPELGYKPWTGWRARKSEKIADFDTTEELAMILQKEEKERNDKYLEEKRKNTNPRVVFGDVIYHDFEYHFSDAETMMEDFLSMLGEEEEW